MSFNRRFFYTDQAAAYKNQHITANAPFHIYVLFTIVLFTTARIVLGSLLELGNDEAYYWLYTQKIQWNYFDHPPMVAWMGRLFSFNLQLQEYEVFVRLVSIVCCAVSTWFIFKAASVLHSEKAGWYAAILYNTSFYSGIIAGLFIMPDSPQMLFWTACLWLMARIMKNDLPSWHHWILFGLSAGACIMSKVHGSFIWFGMGLYILFFKREWLLRPHVYVSFICTLVLISPLLLWNIKHEFVTFRFHSSRVNVDGFDLNHRHFRNELYGQIFFNNPLNFILTILSLLWMILKRNQLLRTAAPFLLTGLPLAAILLFIALFRPIFPHWSGPAYVSLMLPVAIAGAEMNSGKYFRRWLRGCVAAFIVFAVGWAALIHLYPGTWGSREEKKYGMGDVTLDRYGWKEAAAYFQNYYREQVQQQSIPAQTPLVCHKWWGAHVEYYFARPGNITMIGLGRIQDVGTYLWLNEIRKDKVNLNTALCIIPSDEYVDPRLYYGKYYEHIQLVHQILVMRQGKKARHFNIYRLHGWKNAMNWKEE